MNQSLREPTDVPEDQGLVLSTHVAVYNHL